ncbi:conjugative transfer protein MobI(A/C) [Azospirillum argentinense]|uniref:Conjugative transfer protein MobI(A/C) n=1 Tax=Azospirillum argentinense TaxID=2970906 RepID=A0ABW8VCV6_9PROT
MNALRERSGASFRDLLSAVIASEAKRVEAEAQALAEEFYKESADVRATMPPSQHARYSVRVERRAAGVSIRWILIRFFGPKTDRKRFDKTVPRGGGRDVPNDLLHRSTKLGKGSHFVAREMVWAAALPEQDARADIRAGGQLSADQGESPARPGRI